MGVLHWTGRWWWRRTERRRGERGSWWRKERSMRFWLLFPALWFWLILTVCLDMYQKMCCSKQGMNYVHGFCNLVFENMQRDNLLIVIFAVQEKEVYYRKVLGLGACQWYQTYLGMYVCTSKLTILISQCLDYVLFSKVRVVIRVLQTRNFVCFLSLYMWYLCWQMRSPKEVSKEEYNAFCKSTFKEFIDPQAYTHFTTEVRTW